MRVLGMVSGDALVKHARDAWAGFGMGIHDEVA